MSGLANLALAAALAAAPPPKGAEDAGRALVRCRPAPYFVGGAKPQLKAQRLVITGSRVPFVRYERRARPCHLMNAPAEPQTEWRMVFMPQDLAPIRPSGAPSSRP